MIRVLLCLLVILTKNLCAEESIYVELPTENPLVPIYVVDIIDDGAKMESMHLKKLSEVIRFDLNHNGYTTVVNNNNRLEEFADSGQFDTAVSDSQWQKLKAYYVIKLRVTDQKLDARIFSATAAKMKRVDGIQLLGSLSEDRVKIHQLADLITKTLFDKNGIASTRFLYTTKSKSKEGKWLSEVWEADYDGANAKQITKDSGYAVTPTYIPPKTGRISAGCLYVSYKTGQPKIYAAGLNDGNGVRISPLKGNQLMPAISPQRDKIAFISDVTGNPDLFVQDFSPDKGAINKPQHVYTSHLATQATPTFSPDGKQLAFVSNKDGAPRIYVINVPSPGTPLKDIKPKLISKRNKESTAPSWSPDGTKIAFSALTNGVRQIWIYDFEKNEERQITKGPGNKENPAWAPNSLHLIFNAEAELYLINLNSPFSEKISSGSGEKRFPSWSQQNAAAPI